MGNWILTISSYLWIASVLALIVAFLIPTDKSSRFSAAVWIFIGLVMDRLTPYLLSLSEWDQEYARFAWYTTWSAFNTLTILIIWVWHQKAQWQLSSLTKFIGASCLAMVCLQTLRLMDRLLFNTNLLAEVYKFGVPTLNIAVIGAIFIWAASSVKRKAVA